MLDLRNRVNTQRMESTGHNLEMGISQGGVCRRRKRMLASHHGEAQRAEVFILYLPVQVGLGDSTNSYKVESTFLLLKLHFRITHWGCCYQKKEEGVLNTV